jgi:ubiquinone/menaquinone biosynthesis C-methylase UbiE
MKRTSFAAGFSGVDASDDASELIGYLDSVSSITAVKAAKAESLDELGLVEGARGLDVGCGTGEDVLAMARRIGASGHVTGVDLSVAAIEEARRRATSAELPVSFVVANALALPFEDASFDAIRADRAFQHVDAPEAAMAEMARVCAPGGTIVVSEINNDLLIDGSPPRDGIGRAVLDRFWSPTERRSWLGYMLPLLMHRVGLETRLAQSVGQTTDFREIDALAHLGAMAARAVDEGAVSHDDASRWLDDLQRGSKEGTVLLRMRFLHYVGRVPAS